MKLTKKLGLVLAAAMLVVLTLVLGMVGVGGAVTPPDPVSCYCTQPLLSLTQDRTYWPSYADYLSRTLSVDYDVSNNSLNYANAHNMQIVGTSNTAGVISVDHGRNVNMVSAGECELITVRYSVPPGVGAFRSSVYATTSDQCGNGYSYPGAMP